MCSCFLDPLGKPWLCCHVLPLLSSCLIFLHDGRAPANIWHNWFRMVSVPLLKYRLQTSHSAKRRFSIQSVVIKQYMLGFDVHFCVNNMTETPTLIGHLRVQRSKSPIIYIIWVDRCCVIHRSPPAFKMRKYSMTIAPFLLPEIKSALEREMSLTTTSVYSCLRLLRKYFGTNIHSKFS